MVAPPLTPEEVDAVVDVFTAKAARGYSHIEDRGELLRAVVTQVVLDTELLVRGDVPLERWLAPDSP